jgi:hypothetical protein
MAVMTEASAVSPTPSRKMRLQCIYAMIAFFSTFFQFKHNRSLMVTVQGWIIIGHPSYILPIHYSLAFLSFDVKCSEILAVITN